MYIGQVDELVRLCLGHLDITICTSPRLLRQVLICILNCIQNTDYITTTTTATNNITTTTTTSTTFNNNTTTTADNNNGSNNKLYDICMRVITLLPITPLIVQEVALSLLVTVIDKIRSASTTTTSTSNTANTNNTNNSINDKNYTTGNSINSRNNSSNNSSLMYMIYTHILPQLQHFIISLNIDLNRLISSSSTSSTHSSSNPVALWGQAIECVTRLGEYIVCYIL